MTTLLTYAYNSELRYEKIYGLVINTDNTIWLVSTITKGDFLNWQLLKSFDQLIKPNNQLRIEMQIKANKIYILNRDSHTSVLFIIPVEDIATINDMSQYMYNLPAEVSDHEFIYQPESFLIQPTANGADLYICAGNKVLISRDNKRDDWRTFHEFDDSALLMIKASQDIIAVIAHDTGGYIYLAPLGSDNFQKFKLYDSQGKVGIYAVFFHITNTAHLKIMTTLDLQGNVRTFTYNIGQDGIIMVTPAYKEYRDTFTLGDYYPLGIPAASTQFGYKLTIGLIDSSDAPEQFFFSSITIAQDAKISIKEPAIFKGGNERSHAQYKINIDGPTTYLDSNGNFYVSRDVGLTWRQELIVFTPATS